MKSPDHAYQCFTNFAKSVAKKWTNMSPSEKIIFQKAVYDCEEEKKQVKKKAKTEKEKDPNAPKRALPGFMRFQIEQRRVMKNDPSNPKSLPYTGLAKLLSEKWKNMSSEEKEPYRTAAKIDQVELKPPLEKEAKTGLEKYKKYVAECKKRHGSQA